MSAEEFYRWLDGHKAYWPELDGWLNRIDRQEAGAAKRTLDVWRRVLSALSLAEAEEASRKLYEGEHPRGFGQHAAAVKRLARAHADHSAGDGWPQEFVGKEPVYRCGTCLDRGQVAVFEWRMALLEQDARKYQHIDDREERLLHALTHRDQWVVCRQPGCTAASVKLGKRRLDGAAAFDPTVMLPHSLRREDAEIALARIGSQERQAALPAGW